MRRHQSTCGVINRFCIIFYLHGTHSERMKKKLFHATYTEWSRISFPAHVSQLPAGVSFERYAPTSRFIQIRLEKCFNRQLIFLERLRRRNLQNYLARVSAWRLPQDKDEHSNILCLCFVLERSLGCDCHFLRIGWWSRVKHCILKDSNVVSQSVARSMRTWCQMI